MVSALATVVASELTFVTEYFRHFVDAQRSSSVIGKFVTV